MEAIDLISKILSVPIALTGLWKFGQDFATGKAGRMRDEQKYNDEFLTAVKVRTDMHPYSVTTGYQAIAGDATMDPEIIEYLLELADQPYPLKDYVLGMRFLEYAPDGGRFRINFRKFYRNGRKRKAIKLGLFLIFVVLVLGMMSPFFIASMVIAKEGVQSLFGLFGISIFSGAYAVLTAREHLKLQRAERLIESQAKSAQLIESPPTSLKLVANEENGELDQVTKD